MALQKEKNSDINKRPPSFINILIFDGRVTIYDYTHNDEYKILLNSLKQCGVQQDVQTESWCG